MKKVICTHSAEVLNANIGEIAFVVRSFWRNGEGWYLLKSQSGKVFESPDVFWADNMKDAAEIVAAIQRARG